MTRQTTHTSARHTIECLPAAAPTDLLAQLDTAWAAYDRLAAAGRRLHFDLHPLTGRLTAELLDRHGRCLGPVSPRRVLAIAAGDVPA